MPKAAALILTTIAFDVIVQSVAVGIAFFVLLQHLGLKLTPRVTVGALLLLFAPGPPAAGRRRGWVGLPERLGGGRPLEPGTFTAAGS